MNRTRTKDWQSGVLVHSAISPKQKMLKKKWKKKRKSANAIIRYLLMNIYIYIYYFKSDSFPSGKKRSYDILEIPQYLELPVENMILTKERAVMRFPSLCTRYPQKAFLWTLFVTRTGWKSFLWTYFLTRRGWNFATRMALPNFYTANYPNRPQSTF